MRGLLSAPAIPRNVVCRPAAPVALSSASYSAISYVGWSLIASQSGSPGSSCHSWCSAECRTDLSYSQRPAGGLACRPKSGETYGMNPILIARSCNPTPPLCISVQGKTPTPRAQAYLSGGYTMKEIALAFGLHYVTINRAEKPFESKSHNGELLYCKT